jgi:phospholipase/carboxylesterase
MPELLSAITVPPASGLPPQGLVVMLHGWGANAEDVLGLAEWMNLPDCALVFPNAPLPHPFNPVGRMWYDLPVDATGFPDRALFRATAMHQRPDLIASRQQLMELLDALTQSLGIPLARAILGGFSQGGAMALDVGLGLPLAGVISLSGYLHAPVVSTQSAPATLMVHGDEDMVVPLAASYEARDRLKAAGVTVDYHEFAMGHEIQLPALQVMSGFAQRCLAGDRA